MRALEVSAPFEIPDSLDRSRLVSNITGQENPNLFPRVITFGVDPVPKRSDLIDAGLCEPAAFQSFVNLVHECLKLSMKAIHRSVKMRVTHAETSFVNLRMQSLRIHEFSLKKDAL
jgi:hypothetical protein